MATEEQDLIKLLESAEQSSNDITDHKEPDTKAVTESSSTVAPVADSENLNRIIQTREQIAQVKVNLSTIIDSIADNPSLVTRASNVWGAWPTWQKVGTGLVLSVPALLAGVAASIGSLLILGGATGVVYTTTGMILEDHHACNVNIKQRLKEGVLSIADVLELTIVALDNIRLKLAEEIGKFKDENLKLAGQVSTLGDQINTLTIQIEILVETDQFLRMTKENLQQQAVELKKSTEFQSELLKKNQEELAAITRDYKKNQDMLVARVEELRKVRESMAAEVGKTKKVSEAMQRAVSTLSGQVLEDHKQKQAFQSKLSALLDGTDESAMKVIERMTTTQRELEGAKEDLRTNNVRNKELLDRQEELVRRLEKLDLSVVATVGKEVRPSVMGHTLFSTTLGTISDPSITPALTAKAH